MEQQEYNKVLSDEEKVIEAVNTRFNKEGKKWVIKKSSFQNDMNGIDAEGYILTKHKGEKRVLIQIKNISFNKLPEIQQIAYLQKVSNAMSEYDPFASQRLLCYSLHDKSGKINRLYNFDLMKKINKKQD